MINQCKDVTVDVELNIIWGLKYGVSYGIIDLYICPTNVYMHQYIWYSEINDDIMVTRGPTTSVMNWGLE
jgi:hypothetical protein